MALHKRWKEYNDLSSGKRKLCQGLLSSVMVFIVVIKSSV
jgi:hypothetical protein